MLISLIVYNNNLIKSIHLGLGLIRKLFLVVFCVADCSGANNPVVAPLLGVGETEQ